jgi:hypothetical protein
LNNLHKRKRAACACIPHTPTIVEFSNLLSFRGWMLIEVDDTAFCGETLATISCNECGFESKSTWTRCRNNLPSCFCSKKVFWSNPQMRLRFIDVVEQTRFKLPSFAASDESWIEQRLKCDSIIQLQCSKCNQHVRTTLNNFVVRMTTACGCSRFATERIAAEALSNIAAEIGTVSFLTHHFVRYNNGRRGFFDAAVFDQHSKPIMYFELDGEQHFRASHSTSQFEDQMARDRVKEEHCLNHKIPLVRMFQPDVYRNRFDWRCVLKDSIERSLNGELGPLNYHSVAKIYSCICEGRDMCAWCSVGGRRTVIS